MKQTIKLIESHTSHTTQCNSCCNQYHMSERPRVRRRPCFTICSCRSEPKTSPNVLVSLVSPCRSVSMYQGVLVVIFSPLVPFPGSSLFWVESDHCRRARSKGQFLKKSNLFCEISLLQPNYHPIQIELAANGGTQCGYCRFKISQIFLISLLCTSHANSALLSPGMVMQLHSFLQEHPDATMEQIDNILDGNLCR